MKFKLQMVIESDDGNQILTRDVSEWERNAAIVENLGLSLSEAKELLRKTQQMMVREQVQEFLKYSAICPHCEKKRLSKGRHHIVYRTLFGKTALASPRLFYCGCESANEPPLAKTFSPLAAALPERSSPELLYLEAKFGAQISFDLSRQYTGGSSAAARRV